jgi:hypothetical protein
LGMRRGVGEGVKAERGGGGREREAGQEHMERGGGEWGEKGQRG